MAWPFARQIASKDQRRAERHVIDAGVRLRRRSPPVSGFEPALLVNISRLGFLARTDLAIIDGSLVAIELPMLGEVKARSVWSMGREIGAEFLTPIDPVQYENIRAIFDRQREAGL